MRRSWWLLAGSLLGAVLSASAAPPISRLWNEDIIYFALTDRFYDGDPANDLPAGSDPALYDKTQTDMRWYHGGDFRGLELALKNGYFKDLGVTALWITPPVRNVWCSPFDSDHQPKSGYHGYWAQDFLDIDPHLVSRRSLDGTREYPDSRDGRMQHYKDLVDLAHSQGIKVVQDIVCNHAGPVFYYDANGNGKLDADQESEWIEPFKHDGHYDNAHWADIPKWDLHRTAPAGPVAILGREVKLSGAFANLESYGRKGMSASSLGATNGEEVECDFFSLRDFWTAADGPQFDKLVNDFVETYAFYVETVGVDGFRIDTVKHVHHAFWDAFTARLRQRLGPERTKSLLLFGEVYNGTATTMGGYTYREDWPQHREACLDSLLNFEFCYAARSYLRPENGAAFGKASGIEAAFRALMPGASSAGAQRPFYNPLPAPDGLSSAQKMVNFIENHDGLNRFRVVGISERRNLLANALLLLSPGIPCLYYGTEASIEDARGKIGTDTETGRLTLVPVGQAERFDALRKSASYQTLSEFAALRHRFPVLASGEASPLWVDNDASNADDGVFAFARCGKGLEPVIVVINASNKERVTSIPGNRMKLVSSDGKPLLMPGEKLARVPIPGLDPAGVADMPVEVQWKDSLPQVEIHVAPETVNVYHATK